MCIWNAWGVPSHLPPNTHAENLRQISILRPVSSLIQSKWMQQQTNLSNPTSNQQHSLCLGPTDRDAAEGRKAQGKPPSAPVLRECELCCSCGCVLRHQIIHLLSWNSWKRTVVNCMDAQRERRPPIWMKRRGTSLLTRTLQQLEIRTVQEGKASLQSSRAWKMADENTRCSSHDRADAHLFSSVLPTRCRDGLKMSISCHKDFD